MIIVAGTLRVPEDQIEVFMPIARQTLAASRAETGCVTYSYAFDVEEKGLIRIFEVWDSRDDLTRHQSQPHMKPWREKLAEIGASDRDLYVYESAPGERI
jgi:quinol monooxygenase YgiN